MITYIFGLPIYVGSFTDPTEVIKEFELCKNNKKIDIPADETGELGGGLEEDEGTLFDLRNYKEYTTYINSEIENHTRLFLKELNIQNIDLTINICRNINCEYTCADYWFNVYGKGDQALDHWHLSDYDHERFCQSNEVMFAFNYFAKYDKDTHAGLYFVNPSPIHAVYEMIDDVVPAFKRSVKLEINEGQIVIFPSSLVHYVERHQVDDERITLSGNLFKVVDGKK